MAERFRVNNLTEAVNLARQYSASGQYDLFRGQGQNWRVKPTMARLNKSDLEKGLDQLKRLHYYLQTQKPLEKFVSDIDWFYAVAQHYGLPTNYIDFSKSVDVAAFFSTNSKSNKIGEDCVIICLQENDLNEFLKVTKSIYEKDKVVAPYIVKPNVDNLWRLQAQQGCFVYTPYADFEFYYDFDKIIFPFSEPYKDIPIENIYPERKSELEILLDHYFNTEKKLEGQDRFRKFIKENKILHHELPPLSFNHLLKSNTPHSSWQTNLFEEWMFKVDEEWKNTLDTKTLEIYFDFKKPIDDQIQEIIKKLSTSFANQSINRNSSLTFEIIAKPKLSKKLSRTISKSCSRIWDGTRNLPFSDNEIQKIIAKYVCLEIYEDKFDETPSLTTEELITLELTNEYGSITRCYSSASKIISTFRDDIKEILVDDLTQNISSEILLSVNKPDLLFDFNRFLELFKDELIPYQVLYNSEDKNPVIFYTPTQITVMGYA
jgi:hypothetical protein